MIPSAFVILDALPLTPNGKVDLRALPDPEREEDSISTSPRTPAEELLASIWSEVLGRPAVGIHDGFFDLGGHSLLATQVVSRVRRTFGVELPLRALFEAPTVAGFAERVEAARLGGAAAAPPIVPVARDGRDGELPASFAQERLWFLDQLDGGGAAYNVPAGIRLRGRLSVPALAAALNEAVRRHEALRTTFAVAEDSRVLQVVAPELDLPLPVIDLSGPPEGSSPLGGGGWERGEVRRGAAPESEDSAFRVVGGRSGAPLLSSPQSQPSPSPGGGTLRSAWVEQEARQLMAEEAARPFDLARGPLIRARLLRTGPEDHLLVLLMHHIVSDGWSMGVLLREVARLYEGGSLPPVPVQYADYAAWQRGWLRGEALDRQLGWWRDRLAGLPPLLELPIDRPRPPVQGTRGGRMELPLGVDLDSLCRARGVTLFMALLAGFQALLGRLTGREDPPVGTPIANRHRAETEGVIGLFVNTLALPADLSGDPTFAQLLARVRDVTLDAYAHQDLPFEKLVEELRPERGLSHAPVFQVMLILQNAPLAPPAIEGLDLQPLPIDTGTAKFDLTLGVVERPGGSRLIQAEYASDLFDGSSVARLLGSLAGLLRAATADPGRRLSDLPLLSDAERHQALVEWNDTAAPSGEACLHDLIAAQASRTPDAVAVVCRGERVTYSELLRRSRRLANHLRSLGVGDERPVGVCLERTPDLVSTLLGILQAGGVYVPLDPAYPAERLAFLLEDCAQGFDAPLVVTREPLLERLGRPVRSICLDRDVFTDESDPRAGVLPDHLAYLIYTSGSTGRPKAVAIEHRNAAALLRWASDVFPPEDLAGVLASTSINFDLSVFELFVPLALGGTVILADNALALADLPEAAEVRLVNTVPSAMAELIRLDALPPSVRTVNLAGEPLSPALVAMIERRPGVRVLDLYGPSEDTTYSTFARRRGDEPATIGRPLANGRAYVLDRWQQSAPAGAPGELWLGGAGLARGYLHRPELTAERFVPDPFSAVPGERLYRTGDLARLRADGRLEFLGRIDHQVKIRGFRVELGEIEAHLLAHPDVREAAVLALGEGGERRLVAWIVGVGADSGDGEGGGSSPRGGGGLALGGGQEGGVPGIEDGGLRSAPLLSSPHNQPPPPRGEGPTHPGSAAKSAPMAPSPAERGRAGEGVFHAHLAARLPAHMIPSAIGFLDALPRLPNGKVDRRALAALELPGQAASEGFVPPATDDEIRMAAMWAEVLVLPRVGLHDDFFKIGGHSLLATRIVARLRRDFGVELPLRALFQAPTVSRLLAAVEEARASAPGTVAEPVPAAPRIATLSRSASNLRSRSSIGRRESP